MIAHDAHHLRLYQRRFLAVRLVGQDIAAEVGGQHDDCVAEIHRAALAVGQAAVIEHLQQNVEDVLVGFFHLVEQQHLVRAGGERLR